MLNNCWQAIPTDLSTRKTGMGPCGWLMQSRGKRIKPLSIFSPAYRACGSGCWPLSWLSAGKVSVSKPPFKPTTSGLGFEARPKPWAVCVERKAGFPPTTLAQGSKGLPVPLKTPQLGASREARTGRAGHSWVSCSVEGQSLLAEVKSLHHSPHGDNTPSLSLLKGNYKPRIYGVRLRVSSEAQLSPCSSTALLNPTKSLFKDVSTCS